MNEALENEIRTRVDELGKIIKYNKNPILLKMFATSEMNLLAKVLTEFKNLEEEIEDLQFSHKSRYGGGRGLIK